MPGPNPPNLRHTRTALGALVLLSAIACGEDSPAPDAVPPAAVTDLGAFEVSPDSVRLRWTAPGDDGPAGRASRYEIRTHTALLTSTGWDSTGTLLPAPVPSPGGTVEEIAIGGLPAGRRFFALRTADEIPNWSAISNNVEVRIPAGDTTPPSRIVSLGRVGEPTATTVTLAWAAVGDDGDVGRAQRYEIRRHSASFTEEEWDTVGVVVAEPLGTLPPGGIESYSVRNLVPGSVYYFGIRAYDEAGNRSPISNLLRVDTAPLDAEPPAAVTDLAVRVENLYDLVLSWTAPGDDGNTGLATEYDLRYAASEEALEDWVAATRVETPEPARAGTPESVRLDSLSANTDFVFALETLDEAGNRSPRSNLVSISTSDSICVVRPDGSGDYPSIAEALSNGGGCAIELGDGLYQGSDHTNWPEKTATRSIRSASGSSGDCVIDFGAQDVIFPPGLDLRGVTVKNAREIQLRAVDSAGSVLTAGGCSFDGVAFASDQPLDRGPAATFTDCEFRRGTRSPMLDLGEIRAERCSFFANDARIAIAYRMEWIDCDFDDNQAPAGSLIRSFNDLQGTNLFSVESSRFRRNRSPILGPQNGRVEVAGSLFERNTESCIWLQGTATARIETSTFVRNDAPSGSVVRAETEGAEVELHRSLLVGNLGRTLFVLGQGGRVVATCADVFGNQFGDWTGPLSGLEGRDGNLAVDPLFCGWTTDDYTLRADSPVGGEAQPDCGRIGAFDVSCAP